MATAPDFRTQLIEVVSYGETKSFILKDITGEYESENNPGGWDPDGGTGPNLAPQDILYAMIFVTPYKGDDIPVFLEMIDDTDDMYWENVLSHLSGEGVVLDLEMLGASGDGYWQFKSFYLSGYYTANFTEDLIGTFVRGEIVRGTTSGATAYLLKSDSTPFRLGWIQGTFLNGESIVGMKSGSVAIIDTFALVGEILLDEVYSYTNHQSILTKTRNKIRKQPLDIILPRINEKHALNVSIADMMLETLDDAVEVGQIENYITIFDFLSEFIERIDETYCID